MFFYTFLPKLLNMSLTASVAIVFVLLLRLLLKKAPKVISYALWGIVLFRLLCPVSIESTFSLFSLFDTPTTESSQYTSSITYVPEDIVHIEYPEVVLPVSGVSDVINDALPEGEEQLRADPLEAPMTIATYVWMAGVLVMAVYAVVSYLKLKRKLITASPLRDNIYLADEITSPFVMGLVRPKIYLPSSLEEREQSYILLHEQHHIRRLDHIVKAVAFVALCIHWFNPLVWLAFILAGKDMEMSCDEAVVKKMGEDIRADYTASLLSLATGNRIIAGMPLAFGEGDTKGRIHNLANWRKPAFWVILVAIIACLVLGVCLLTNPMERQTVLMGANYDIEETLFSMDLASEESTETPLQYSVTADYHLYVKYTEDGGWNYLGELEEYPLTKDELLSYVPFEKIDNYRLSEITDAYILHVEDDNFYMVMQTKSGDTLLTYGWEDMGERGDEYSDDTTLRRIYLLKSTFHEGYVNTNFFMRSLRTTVDANVYTFSSYESDRFPGYHIEGFKCGESEDHREMTDMGYAVFQTTGAGYRLIDCKVYEDATLVENGVYFCADPIVADVNGEMRNDNTFDVVLVCNENVGRIERVYHMNGKEDVTEAEMNISTHCMVIWSWDYSEDCTSISQNVYDKEGNLLSTDNTIPVNSASWEDMTNDQIHEATEWFDYLHSSEMPWSGRQEINMDAFPGVTFRWMPEKVEAITDDEITPLYTGMPIWSVFFTDLTGDGLPELCSTISIGSGMIDNRVIIYDYANGVSYSLEDRGNYDFTLSLVNGKLLVTKKVYNTDKIVETGYLAYEDETLQIVPAELYQSPATVSELIPGTTYVPYQCIYMNPLSSYAALGGDSGCKYIVSDSSFVIVNRDNGAVISISSQPAVEDFGENRGSSIAVDKWEWQDFPYTEDQWLDLFKPDGFNARNIYDLFDKIQYQPLTEELFLLRVDGDIWLVELSSGDPMGTYLWSIYSLVPEDSMGVAQWEYAPMLSSRSPVFRFEFDMPYTEVSAVCTESLLSDFDNRENPQDDSSSIVYSEGNALCWSPMDKAGNIVGSAVIRFTVHREDMTIASGTIYIESTGGSSSGRPVYKANLVGTGLHLSPNTEREGGVISFINTTEEIAVTEHDLTTGKLEISLDELDSYVFYTNSTQIKVTVKKDGDFSGSVQLLDISQANGLIGVHEIDNRDKKVTFTGLTSTRLYRIVCEGFEDATVIISG